MAGRYANCLHEGPPLLSVDSSRAAITGGYGGVSKFMRQGFPPNPNTDKKSGADFNAVPVATKACDRGPKAAIDAN
jgi:hypothetical protein